MTVPTSAARPVERADVIVIGSGVGGLVTGSLLAQLRGLRVIVLERHFKLGGFNHTFTRRGYHWDVGIHYVGQMAPGRRGRRLMDLATGGAVRWNQMPDDFDVFHYPEHVFAVPSDPEEFIARLVAAFPAEREALAAYRADLKAAAGWYSREFMSQAMPRPARGAAWRANRTGRELALMTTADYLTSRFADPRLRGLLASQWGDYALPPARSSFAIHAMIVLHYDRGAYYPVGGSDVMTDAFVAQIERAGGSARPGHTVTGIIVEGGRAVGVRAHVKKGRGGHDAEFRAPVVVSDAGARLTFGHLLPEGSDPALVESLSQVGSGTAFATLYAGLHTSPTTLGFAGENHWLFDDYDHDAGMTDHTERLFGGYAQAGFLSFPSLKDPEATTPHRRDRHLRRRGRVRAVAGHRVDAPRRGLPQGQGHHRSRAPRPRRPPCPGLRRARRHLGGLDAGHGDQLRGLPLRRLRRARRHPGPDPAAARAGDDAGARALPHRIRHVQPRHHGRPHGRGLLGRGRAGADGPAADHAGGGADGDRLAADPRARSVTGPHRGTPRP